MIPKTIYTRPPVKTTMRKRGALFYIIDAFVAASIIAMTMTVIFAAQLNTPKTDAAQDTLSSYITYLQKTSIFDAPGTTKDLIIEKDLIDKKDQSIISAVAQLVRNGNLSTAQELLAEVNELALESQFGLNITMSIDGTSTEVTTRKLEREDVAKTFLQKSIMEAYRQESRERLYTKEITTSGDAACGTDECLYVIDDTAAMTSYDENDCSTNHGPIGLKARCYNFTAPQAGIIITEVSIWS